MRNIGAAIGLIVVFLGVTTLLYLGLGMISTIPAPDVGDEGYTEYTSLTEIVQMSFLGFEGVLLLLIVVMMIIIFTYMYSTTRRTW